MELPIALKSEDEYLPLELELWFDGGFQKQIRDIYPEVLRLKGCEDENAVQSQWNTVIDLVSMTMLDSGVGQDVKEELIGNIERIRAFYADDGTDEETAFNWWEQWRCASDK